MRGAWRPSIRAVAPPAADGKGALVLLDRTVFYPGGGGQPADRGEIRAADGRTWRVVAARKDGDEIWHELEPGTEAPPAGPTVFTADLDWERRLRLMRTHTALHALCGVVWRDYGALVTGGNMEPGGGRMDFEFERMSRRAGRGDRDGGQRGAGDGPRRPCRLPAARGGLRDPRPDPDEGEPAAAGDRDDPHDRDRRARPAGRRRHARRQHPRGRRDPRDRLRDPRAASTSGSGWSWWTDWVSLLVSRMPMPQRCRCLHPDEPTDGAAPSTARPSPISSRPAATIPAVSGAAT